MDRLEQTEQPIPAGRERQDWNADQAEAEIRRLKSELELRDLYIEEMHAALSAQVNELAALDDRLRRLEPPGAQAIPSPIPVNKFRR